MMCGGYTEQKPITPEVAEMVNSMKTKIEANMNAQYSEFEAVSYSSQVVAGTNFNVKVKVGADSHIQVTIFRPLPCNGTELEVTNVVAL